MTSEPARSWTGAASLFLPAAGLSLLGEDHGSGHAGRRFLVGRSDGPVIQLPLLLYLIMAAIAEGSVDGGWSADQVSAQVEAASGQGLTADNVRCLIAGTLAPLGLIAADDAAGDAANGAGRPDGVPGAARLPRVGPRPAPQIHGLPSRHRAAGTAGTAGRVLTWPMADRVERLLLRCRRRRWALVLGGTAVLVSVAATAPIMAGTGNHQTGGARAAASATTSAAASASAVSASQSQAAAWVAQQVSPEVTVSCDPGMCRRLRQDGFPAARLEPLPRGARGPLGSGVVVATPAVQSQFGTRLDAAYAPQVIASFGSGAARVAVRTVAPDGAAAFRAWLAAEMTALAPVGRQLLGNRNIQASPSAQAELRAGQVDARLLAILALLSAQVPVRLVSFTAAPGADPGAPLRTADISVSSTAARSAILALLNAQQNPYRPAMAVTHSGSHPMIALRFDAPASLNISQP